MTVNAPSYPHPFDPAWRQPGSSSAPQLPRRGVRPRWRMGRKVRRTLITIGLVCASLPCIGGGHRTRQPECSGNLKSLFTGLRTQQRVLPETNLDTIGFAPERGNRYAYFLGVGPMEDRSAQEAVSPVGKMGIGVDTFRHKGSRNLTLQDLPPELAKLAGAHGSPPDLEFVMLCAGDVDNNPLDTPDIWSIATMDRVIDGENIAAGEPYNHVNDMTTD
jgi:type IV pilus assembly protein PilA